MKEKKESTKALIRLLFNAREQSWHPVILVELLDKEIVNGLYRFGTRWYRKEGFYVRDNAIKAITTDMLVEQLKERAYTRINTSTDKDLYWSGTDHPHIIRRVKAKEVATFERCTTL